MAWYGDDEMIPVSQSPGGGFDPNAQGRYAHEKAIADALRAKSAHAQAVKENL